jgi:hypothetical protein
VTPSAIGQAVRALEARVGATTPPPVAAEILPQAELAGLLGRRRPRFTDLYLQLRRPFRNFSM